jgi:hypothetical protein
MSELAMPDGSTIRSIVESVTEDYVRSVLTNVTVCEREMGDARVSVSLMGDRRFPDYNISAVMDVDTGQAQTWQSFSGKTHKPLRPAQEKLALWSCGQMTWREVSALIGEIRRYKVASKSAEFPEGEKR